MVLFQLEHYIWKKPLLSKIKKLCCLFDNQICIRLQHGCMDKNFWRKDLFLFQNHMKYDFIMPDRVVGGFFYFFFTSTKECCLGYMLGKFFQAKDVLDFWNVNMVIYSMITKDKRHMWEYFDNLVSYTIHFPKANGH